MYGEIDLYRLVLVAFLCRYLYNRLFGFSISAAY